MTPKQLQFWTKTFETTEKWMQPHHKLWRRLIKLYELDFSAMDIPESKQKKISRFYPLTRQIIASTVFQNPRVFMRVEDDNREMQAEVLERVVNDGLDLIHAKRHVQQQVFDSLYCYKGILKCGINPRGDNDIVAPYVANDVMQNGMFYVARVSPFNFYTDIMTPPHDPGQARFDYEKMLVPLEFVKKDKRFKGKVKEVKPITTEDLDEMLSDWEDTDDDPDGQRQLIERAKQEGEYVQLREVHDRLHKKRYTFAQGVEQPIEEIPHPFLAGETTVRLDPITGDERVTGQFKPTGGYLVAGGTPYIKLSLDMNHEGPYGKPMMAYAEDTQLGIAESVSRRSDGTKRNSRMFLGRKSEQQENPNIEEDLEQGKDGKIAWVDDVNNAFAEMPQATPPSDQLGLESDYRNYEEQILNVSQMAMGGGSKVTATQAALTASFGQLNRDWMQDQVAAVFEDMSYNMVRLMGDKRFEPKNFLVNVARDEEDPVFQVVRSDMLQARFRVEVEAGSMKPMFEELEKEDALALFGHMIQLPEIPRIESIKYLLRAFRVPNQEKLIGEAANVDARRSAEYENTLFLAGQASQVHPKENHRVHMEVHQLLAQSPQWQQLVQTNPMLAQQLAPAIDKHLQEHQQALQGQATGAPANISSLGDAGGSPVGRQLGKIDSAVRSNAQDISQPGALDRDQN
jgi:hypothetical protein